VALRTRLATGVLGKRFHPVVMFTLSALAHNTLSRPGIDGEFVKPRTTTTLAGVSLPEIRWLIRPFAARGRGPRGDEPASGRA
jgi:hypothetical protein